MKNIAVDQYHCPNCNAEDTLWPKFIGKKKTYVCSNCGEMYGTSQLNKLWGRDKDTKSITVSPVKEKEFMNILDRIDEYLNENVQKRGLHIKDLKAGMKVKHDSWNQQTSEPLLVVLDGSAHRKLKDMETGELSDILAGGEDEWGWFEV